MSPTDIDPQRAEDVVDADRAAAAARFLDLTRRLQQDADTELDVPADIGGDASTPAPDAHA